MHLKLKWPKYFRARHTKVQFKKKYMFLGLNQFIRAYRFKSMEKCLETEQKVPSSVKSALRRVSAEKCANPTN